MCTVTIVPTECGYRLACNRDERRSRPLALPPRRRRIGYRDVLFPIDPVSGGTWIAINDTRLAFVILNRAGEGRERRSPLLSRGVIIPLLAGHRSIRDAARAARSLDPAAFDPFQLVIVQDDSVATVSSDGQALTSHQQTVDTPVLFTSSSLGDGEVEPLRRMLFERMVRGTSDERLAGQSRFHAHQWPGHGEVSVLMTRSEARTVSRTLIDASEEAMRLRYEPVPEAAAA